MNRRGLGSAGAYLTVLLGLGLFLSGCGGGGQEARVADNTGTNGAKPGPGEAAPASSKAVIGVSS